MSVKDNIKAYYLQSHKELEQKYYVDKSITKKEFDRLHGELWNNYDTDLIVCANDREAAAAIVAKYVSDVKWVYEAHFKDKNMSEADYVTERDKITSECEKSLIDKKLITSSIPKLTLSVWYKRMDDTITLVFSTAVPDNSYCIPVIDQLITDLLSLCRKETWVK